MKSVRLKCVGVAVCLWVLCVPGGCVAGPAPATAKARTRVVLAGDSLVSTDVGWGGAFAERLKDRADVANACAGGHSSASYRKDPQWKKALDSGAGLMLLELGTNDSPAYKSKHPTTPEQFANNLRRYLKQARDHGIRPVVVTPLARRVFDDDGRIVSDVMPYADKAVEVARTTGTPCIDLHAWTKAYFEKLGPDAVLRDSPFDRNGSIDTTHLTKPWQGLIATAVIADLEKIEPGLVGP